jgi:hypothetical protein
MSDLRVDLSTGDLLLENGDLVLTDDDAPLDVTHEVCQRVRQRLLTFVGEWFEDTRRGVDWHDSILIRPFNRARSEGIIRATIAETAGVDEIVSFSMTISTGATRSATIYCAIRTGDIVLPLEVSGG